MVAEVVEHGRGKKLLVFKYKAKTRYRRRQGHRQEYTRLAIRQIDTGEKPAEAAEKPKRAGRGAKAGAPSVEAKPRRARRAAKVEEAPPEPVVEAEAEAAREAKPARRRRARKAEATAKEETKPKRVGKKAESE